MEESGCGLVGWCGCWSAADVSLNAAEGALQRGERSRVGWPSHIQRDQIDRLPRRAACFAQPLDGQCKDRWLAIRSEAHVEPAEHLELFYQSLRVRMAERTFCDGSRRVMGQSTLFRPIELKQRVIESFQSMRGPV